MGQRYLIDSVKQNLDDIRDIIITDSDCCIPHKENGLYYSDVETSNDNNDFMLCVNTNAEVHLTQVQRDLLIDEIPVKFIDETL